MRVTAGVNRAHPGSGIADATWTTRMDPQNGTRRPALYCHPMISSTGFIIDNFASLFYGQKALVEALADPGGYTLAGSDLGYFNSGGLGNPAEQVRIGELDAWSHQSIATGGAGGQLAPRLAVGISAGTMGIFNYFGQAGDPTDCAAYVIILPPWDLDALYANDTAGLRSDIEAAWGVTWPTPLPPFASPKENGPAFYGTTGRIYFAPDDPVNGQAVIDDMLATLGPNWTAINLGNLGHTEAAIAAIDKPNLIRWCHDVAPPM